MPWIECLYLFHIYLEIDVADVEFRDTVIANVWQSRVEIEHYSVAYFDRVTAFKALQHRIRATALGLCNVVELRNGIM